MRNLLAHMATCLLGGVVSFLFLSPAYDRANKSPSQFVENIEENSLQKQLNDLKAENAQLMRQLIAYDQNSLKNDRHVFHLPETAPMFSVSSSSSGNTTELAQHFEQFKKIYSLNNYLNGITDQDESALYRNLEEGFSAEAIDYNWAPDYEQKIQQLIDERDPFNALAYTSINCKTHRCQIKITAQTPDAANQLAQSFAEVVNNNSVGINAVQVLSAANYSLGFLDLYIAKDNSINAFE